MSDESLEPVGFIHTPYKEKFGIPRQPGLINSARGCIKFTGQYNDENMLRGLEEFSHLWLIFQFHQTKDQGWSPLVRPPRLGGNQKRGVFATRSTFRPNGLGLSVVTFDGIDKHKGQLCLFVKGMDLLDQTPIIDIKPYIPYADNIPEANGGFAAQAPTANMHTEFSKIAQQQLHNLPTDWQAEQLIREVLGQDPRPAYKQGDKGDRIYGIRLFDINVRWQVNGNTNQVLEIQSINA